MIGSHEESQRLGAALTADSWGKGHRNFKMGREVQTGSKSIAMAQNTVHPYVNFTDQRNLCTSVRGADRDGEGRGRLTGKKSNPMT